jgi:choline dehydrogenase
VGFDVVVVGGGTAGCVLAARLSESPDRSVCLVEAGPDYGPLADGRWPQEILDPRSLPSTHSWGPGGEDGRSLGGRVLGGSSAVNACIVVEGTPADYDEWGESWSYSRFRPYLARARETFRTATRNSSSPGSFHPAFLAAAQTIGFPLLVDMDDATSPVGGAPCPANVVEGTRWNAAFAYLDPCRSRENLTIVPEALVDRIVLHGRRAIGVVTADGRVVEAKTIVLSAGAYFSPAILMRSGIGPESDLAELDIRVVEDLPTGKRLLDHCGTNVAWNLSPALLDEASSLAAAGELVEPHAVVKAASSACPPGSWDLHLLSWIYPTDEPHAFEASAIVFHMKPLSAGRVSLRSTDPHEPPLVQRGFLSRKEDLTPVVEGIALARRLGETEPLRSVLADEVRPAREAPEDYVRGTIRNYFHPAGTCGMGAVVDERGRVLGVEGLVVADASIMPTIPRANTNLTTAAIAELLAETL